MNKEKILELFNKHLRIEITYPGSLRERSNTVIRQISSTNEPGSVIYSEMNETNADTVIEIGRAHV